MKKLLSILLTVCLVLSLSCVCVFAQETEEDVAIPILTIDENATESEIIEAINSTIENSAVDTGDDIQSANGYIEIKPFLIRSGITSSCQLYLRWNCPGYQCSMISFSLLQLHNGSALFPEIYSNIGGSTIQCETGESGSAFVLNVNIPTSVSTVYATSKNVMAFILSEGWISTMSISGRVPFN